MTKVGDCYIEDDIFMTVKSGSSVVLQAANKLHPNLQLLLETSNENDGLAFLDINMNLDGNKQVK